MKEKEPTINLMDIRSYCYEEDHFKVKSIKNSTEFQVGRSISTKTVNRLIAQGWNVNIGPNEGE